MNNNIEPSLPNQTAGHSSSSAGIGESMALSNLDKRSEAPLEVFLAHLTKMHPLLPETTAQEYAHRASLGLGRHGHSTKVTLLTRIDSISGSCNLHWTLFPDKDNQFLDYHRITEDSAEAIALGVVNVFRGWVVRRRLQRGEFADWLLIDKEGRLIALEVSGIDKGDGQDRLLDKVQQVSKSSSADSKAACVVELTPPRALLHIA